MKLLGPMNTPTNCSAIIYAPHIVPAGILKLTLLHTRTCTILFYRPKAGVMIPTVNVGLHYKKKAPSGAFIFCYSNDSLR